MAGDWRGGDLMVSGWVSLIKVLCKMSGRGHCGLIRSQIETFSVSGTVYGGLLMSGYVNANLTPFSFILSWKSAKALIRLNNSRYKLTIVWHKATILGLIHLSLFLF